MSAKHWAQCGSKREGPEMWTLLFSNTIHFCWSVKAQRLLLISLMPYFVIWCYFIHSFIHQVFNMYKALFQKSFKVTGVSFPLVFFLHLYRHSDSKNTVEYYSAVKKNELMPFVATWMDLERIILSEIRQRRRSIIWRPLCVKSKKKRCRWTYKTERHRLREQTYGG